jgi:hypothetical protein
LVEVGELEGHRDLCTAADVQAGVGEQPLNDAGVADGERGRGARGRWGE